MFLLVVMVANWPRESISWIQTIVKLFQTQAIIKDKLKDDELFTHTLRIKLSNARLLSRSWFNVSHLFFNTTKLC